MAHRPRSFLNHATPLPARKCTRGNGSNGNPSGLLLSTEHEKGIMGCMAEKIPYLDETARTTRIVDEVDVLVCGGGPAGVAAAVAAARAGASVRLLELNGCLGGVWTAGLLSWVIDSGGKGGLMRDIRDAVAREPYASDPDAGNFSYHAEDMKLLLERLCLEAGVRVRLYTRVVAAPATDGRIEAVITESKSGREAWRASVYVDATGDGDLAALAGCAFDMGTPDEGNTQPLSLMALLTGLDAKGTEPYRSGLPNNRARKERLNRLLRDHGVEPSYAWPTIFRIHDDLYALMANHQYGVHCNDAQALTDATIRAREEIHQAVQAMVRHGGPFAQTEVVATAEQIGVREGRRIHGLYQVTLDDLVAGRRHEDAVCRVTFGIDVHSVSKKLGATVDVANDTHTQPYDIPLRALMARDVHNLMMAGRCISGDFLAHSSYRVTGNAVAMGEAAGTCAALSSRDCVHPRDITFEDVARCLSS